VDIRPAIDVMSCKVNSVSDGKVIFGGLDNNGANMVDIFQSGYLMRYLHGSDRLLSKDQMVNTQTAVFNMGCTGRCDGRHLHFELSPSLEASYGTQLDPQLFNFFGYLVGVLIDPIYGRSYLSNGGDFDWERIIYKITKTY